MSLEMLRFLSTLLVLLGCAISLSLMVTAQETKDDNPVFVDDNGKTTDSMAIGAVIATAVLCGLGIILCMAAVGFCCYQKCCVEGCVI